MCFVNLHSDFIVEKYQNDLVESGRLLCICVTFSMIVLLQKKSINYANTTVLFQTESLKYSSPKKRQSVSLSCLDPELRPFLCPWEGCTMAFKMKHHLKDHMRRHTGERPFECHVCGYRSRQKSTLAYHIRTRHASASKKTK